MNQRVAISSLGIQTQGLVVSSILSKPGAGPLFERSSSASTLSTLYSRVKIRCSGGCSYLWSSAMVSYSSPMAAACEDGENQPSLCEVYHLLAASLLHPLQYVVRMVYLPGNSVKSESGLIV